MKRKIILIFLGIGFIILNLFYVTSLTQESNLSDFITMNSAQAEDPPPIFIKTTHDCSITIEGEAGAYITIFGVRYKIPLDGSLELTFSDVAVDCASGGNQMCSYFTCAMFWQGSGA